MLTAMMALLGTGVALANTTVVNPDDPVRLPSPIYGTVLASDAWNQENSEPQTGLYSYDAQTLTPVVIDYYLAAMGGGAYVDGTYRYNFNFSFMGSLAQNFYLIYDFASDAITGWELYETTYADIATQVAYDETTGQVYGQFYNRDRSARVWGTRDLENGETHPIRPMIALDLRALAFDRLGRAWAVDAQGDLLLIDKLTGYYTVVGNTGLDLAQTTQQSGAINPLDDTFYMIAVSANNTSAIWAIDYASAHASKVCDMPANEQVTGAYFMPLEYADYVPAAPTEVQVNFEHDALTGTVTCVAPSVNEGGQPLTEGAELQLCVDDKSVCKVQTTPGQTVSMEVTVEKAGTHIFQIRPYLGSVSGRKATVHQWIGLDVPEAVTDLAARNTDNTHALLTWTAPTEGVHGGYIDPAHLRYMVLDSEGTVVATALTDTQCEVSKTGSRLTARTYSVIAMTDSEPGLSATSNRVYFGNRYKVPYSTYFDTQNEFDLWYVVDANDDGSTWSYEAYNRYVHYTYHKYNKADDWLFSAPIHLKAEQYYDLSSNMAAEMTFYRERFEIMVCNAQHPDSVVAVVRRPTETEKDGKEERRFYAYNDWFCVPAEGDYYLAYHCISDPDQLRLELRSLDLTAGAVFDAPDAAQNAVFRPGSFGGSSASVEFDAPTTSIRGEQLTSLTKAELYNGNTLCATLTDIVPGQHYTIIDGQAPRGYVDYRLVIYNEYGKGLPVAGTVYVGIDTPSAPQNVQISLVGNDIYMTWDPVTTGTHGGYIDASKINYKVVRQNDIVVIYDGFETECSDISIPNHGAQTTYYYGIFAYYGTTPSEGTATEEVIMGTPYTMPFEETFANDGSSSTLWLIGYDPYNTWGTSWSLGEEPSYDSKPGNLTCTASLDEGGYHFVSSGKIRVNAQAVHPVLTFAYQCAGMNDSIDVVISTEGVPNQGDVVATVRPSAVGEWDLGRVDLTPYKDEIIIVTWHCHLAQAGDVVLDDVRVYDDPQAGIDQTLTDSFVTDGPVYDLQGRRTEPGKAGVFVITPSRKIITLKQR